MEHIFNFDIEHRFLPKTSLLLTTSYGITSHYNADATSAASFNIVDSTPISSKIGLLGVITPKLALRLLLGWAYVIYDSGTNFNSFVSNIEFTYSFSKKTSFVLGFENSFKDVLFSNYLGYYNLYIKNDISLTNSFSLGFNIDAILNSYTGISLGNSVTSPSERTDINLELSGLLSYNYKERYKTELKYTMTKVITDFTTEYEGVTTNYDYLQHKVAINFFIFF